MPAAKYEASLFLMLSAINSVVAYYQLVEIATGKTVVSDSTVAHVDYARSRLN